MHEVRRYGMINSRTKRRERGHDTQEAVNAERGVIERFDLRKRINRIRNRSRNVTGAEIRWKWSKAAAGEPGIKWRSGVEPLLHWQFDTASSHVANLKAGVTEQFVLNTERPTDDLRIDLVRD